MVCSAIDHASAYGGVGLRALSGSSRARPVTHRFGPGAAGKHPGYRSGALPKLHAAGGNWFPVAAGGHGRSGDYGQEEAGMNPAIPIHWYLYLGTGLFTIGVIGVLTRRSVIVILMSIEMILNAVNINLVAFSQMFHSMDGQV